jgi:hypothetical protein
MSQAYYTGNPQIGIYPLPGDPSVGNTCFRFTDKANNECERELIANYWAEQIALYGQSCNYYVNNFSLLSGDLTYGEQPTQTFSPPVPLIIAINLNESALLLTKYGYAGDDELTGYIAISAFYNVFGFGAEPKSGDVFQLTEYGNDRPGGRDGKFFEITQREDEDASLINQLASHTVWMIKAKRFEWSYEPGLSGEAANQQVYGDTLFPGASASPRPYNPIGVLGPSDQEAKSIFNYSVTNYDSEYGNYGSSL